MTEKIIADALIAYCQRWKMLPTDSEELICELAGLCDLSCEEIIEFLED